MNDESQLSIRETKSSEDDPVVYLVDASIYVFRAWFSMPADLLARDGRSVNAVFGFARFICELLEQAQPQHIGVAWDESLSTSFRNKLYPPYKANRDPAPEDLKLQFSLARQLVESLGIYCIASDRYEADDLVATLAAMARREGFRNALVTADKDFAQILEDGDFIWDFARRRMVTAETIRAEIGIHAWQVPDYLALAGDSVDNIPGLTGIGAKTAALLLGHFDDLEAIYAGLDDIASLAVRGRDRIVRTLLAERDNAYLFRDLTRLAMDVPLASSTDVESMLARSLPDWQAVEALIDDLQLGSGLLGRLEVASTGI